MNVSIPYDDLEELIQKAATEASQKTIEKVQTESQLEHIKDLPISLKESAKFLGVCFNSLKMYMKINGIIAHEGGIRLEDLLFLEKCNQKYKRRF